MPGEPGTRGGLGQYVWEEIDRDGGREHAPARPGHARGTA